MVNSMMEQASVIMHLFAFAQIGTVTRIYIGKLFGGSCNPGYAGSWDWVPCTTSPGISRYGGGLFQDLPANVAGSFAMGLFASTDVLKTAFPSWSGAFSGAVPMAMLPPAWDLQSHSSLHVGMRTGFCGSLTTYSSWILQMVEMMVGGNPAFVGSDWVSALWGLYVNVAVSMTALVVGQHVALLLHKQFGSKAHVELEIEASSSVGAENGHTAGATSDTVREAVKAACEPPMTSSCCWRGGVPRWLVDLLVLLIGLMLTGVSLAYAITEGTGSEEEQEAKVGRRYIWFSILLCPVGCLLRWQLSQLNGKAGWFPLGTWTANMIACVINFVLQLLLVRLTDLSVLQQSILSGIITGISGALSTVSTWVVELQKLSMGLPANTHAYWYGLASVVPSVALGLLIYGTGVWTM